MNVFKTLLCGAAIFALTSCSNPASDGEKYATLKYERSQAADKHGYDSEEYKKADEAVENFEKEMLKKYGDDKDAQKKFDDAYKAKRKELREEE